VFWLDEETIAVGHSIKCWLPLTELWQYDQVVSLPPGIANHILCDCLDNTEQFGFVENATVLCSEIEQDKRADYLATKFDSNFKTISARLLRLKALRKNQRFLRAQFEKHSIRILHSHFGQRGWRNIGVFGKSKVKHLVSFYGVDLGYLLFVDLRWRKRYRELFDVADLVLAEGPGMAERLEDIGCPGEKVIVHHLGVRLERLPFILRKRQEDEAFRVLIAASFREKKGITYAVEALKRLNRIIPTPIRVTIVGDSNGSGQSVREKQRIFNAVKDASFKTQKLEFTFTGLLDHARLLREAYKHHVFLSPSVTASDGDIEGGAPITLIEMAATGMLVVSTYHCDIPNVFQNTKTGFLTPERDVEGLVGHLLYIHNNLDKCDDIAKAARMRVDSDFNAHYQGLKLSDVYRSLLTGGSGQHQFRLEKYRS
jgi:colanic acid/amylovoran biosynthesis glycosyltransferase